MEYTAYFLLIGLIWCIIWGIVVNKVIENKGYQENWFWWGFFFGIFALIVALTKQSVNTTKVVLESTSKNDVKQTSEMLTKGINADKVDINSMVHILSWDIQKENNIDLVLAVDFLNVSESIISAVMFTAVGFNSFGDKVLVNGNENFDVMGQDISIKPSEHGKVQIVLPSADIRKVELKVKKICLSDGKIVENAVSKWIDTKQNPLSATYLDCVRRKNSQGRYYSIIEKDYWQCVCGFVNVGNSCKSCNMRKLVASEFTQDSMEDTYKKYLKELETEEKLEEERRIEAEKRAEAEKLEKERKEKAYIRKWIIAGSILIIVVVGISVFTRVAKEKRYEEERIIISQCIENEEYDNAYSVMISSDSYDKLKVEYGDILWKKQEELDKTFFDKSWTYVWNKDEMIYNEALARDGICYYTLTEETEYATWKYIYAVTESEEKYQIFSEANWLDDGYVYIAGLGYHTWEEYSYNTMWSNGWLFISVSKKDATSEEHQYAIRYDEESGVKNVVLSDEFGWDYSYVKMKDGNILIVSETIDDIRKAETIKLFDVVKGEVKELSYNELKSMYNDDITENILIMFE